MRVLLDCRMADWSGVGRYTRGLARALARRSDVELVQAVAPNGTAPVPEAETRQADRPVLSLGGPRELGRIARAVDPDVVHCPHYPIPSPVTHPLVVTIQDLGPLLVEGVMTSALRRAVYRHWNREALRVADRVITPSEYTACTVREFAPESACRICVIPDAADDFTAGPAGERPAVAVPPYVLSMGNTRAHKDLPTLLRAFATIAASRADLRLVLVGEDHPGYAAAVLGDDPAARRVFFTGHLEDDALRAAYAGAAVFAFPSRFEGFGFPPLEAMSLGTPVVCAQAASLPEVVDDAALLFDPGDSRALADALGRVLDVPQIAEGLRERGRERAAEFRWEEVAGATVRVYEEAVVSDS